MRATSYSPGRASFKDAWLRSCFGREACAQPLDLTPRSLDHPFEVGDELFIDGVVGGPERIERSRACAL
jgi:hypothetical protein